MKIFKLALVAAVLAWSGVCADAQAVSGADAVLKKSADAVFKSDTLYYSRSFFVPASKDKKLRCDEEYSLQNNADGSFDALFHSTIFSGAVGVSNMNIVYLKNKEGFWDIYPALAINIAGLVKEPPSIDPFGCLRTVTAEHYALSLSETNDNNRAFYVVTGRSLQEDADKKVSITNGFIPIALRYVIDKATFLPHELYQEFQNGMKSDKVFDKIELHREFDADLFALNGKTAKTPANLHEYADLKVEGMKEEFPIKKSFKLPPEVKNVAQKRNAIRAACIVVLAAVPLTLIVVALKKKRAGGQPNPS